jgi:hypothetical protein
MPSEHIALANFAIVAERAMALDSRLLQILLPGCHYKNRHFVGPNLNSVSRPLGYCYRLKLDRQTKSCV